VCSHCSPITRPPPPLPGFFWSSPGAHGEEDRATIPQHKIIIISNDIDPTPISCLPALLGVSDHGLAGARERKRWKWFMARPHLRSVIRCSRADISLRRIPRTTNESASRSLHWRSVLWLGTGRGEDGGGGVRRGAAHSDFCVMSGPARR
jgi:hypothetical protein